MIRKDPVFQNCATLIYVSVPNMVDKAPFQSTPNTDLERRKLYKEVQQRYSELRTTEWLKVVPKEQRKQVIAINHDPPTFDHIRISKTAWISVTYYKCCK